MKLAVNYSTPLKKLIQAEEVRVDLIKCPEWDAIVIPALSLGAAYIHFEISLGNNKVQGLNFDLIQRMFDLTGTKFLNTHLANDTDLMPQGKKAHKELLAKWESDLDLLRSRFPDKPVIAENLPWHPFLPQLELACDPELISSFLIANDVGLLLDLSHAQISSAMLGIDFHDYVSRLPLDRLEELHITGIRNYNGYMSDHFEMQEQDWETAAWAANQIRSAAWKEPQIAAFEYGGVGDVFCWRTQTWVLQEQVPRLFELFSWER